MRGKGTKGLSGGEKEDKIKRLKGTRVRSGWTRRQSSKKKAEGEEQNGGESSRGEEKEVEK